MRIRIFFLTLLLFSNFSAGEVSQTISFRHFLYDFFQNPAFQIKHVSDPYTYITILGDDIDSRLVPLPKNLEDWKHLEGPEHYRCKKNCYDLVIYDSFDKTHDKSDKRVLAFEGVENGINESLYFELISNEWYLVKYESFSN